MSPGDVVPIVPGLRNILGSQADISQKEKNEITQIAGLMYDLKSKSKAVRRKAKYMGTWLIWALRLRQGKRWRFLIKEEAELERIGQAIREKREGQRVSGRGVMATLLRARLKRDDLTQREKASLVKIIKSLQELDETTKELAGISSQIMVHAKQLMEEFNLDARLIYREGGLEKAA